MIDDTIMERIIMEYPLAEIEVLWGYFKLFKGEGIKDYRKLYNKIRFGHDINFDLESYVNNRLQEKHSKGITWLEQWVVPTIMFDDELEWRRDHLIAFFKENAISDDPMGELK